MPSKNKKSVFKKIVPETGVLISWTIHKLAGSTARWIIIGLAILIIGYLSYGWIWQPLQNRNVVPPGVNLNIGTDPNVLQTINNQRAERAQHIPYDFAREAQVIAPNRGNANTTDSTNTTP